MATANPTQYEINRGICGVNGFGSLFCNQAYSTTLGASTEATLTVPSTSGLGNINATTNPQYLAVFSYKPTADVWVALNQTAAVPAGNTLAATTSCLNPSAKLVKGGDVIHVISAGATDVGIELYYLQEG